MPLALSRTGIVFKKCYINNAGDFSRLARNAYKVLLTRGLRGCVIYSVPRPFRATALVPCPVSAGMPMYIEGPHDDTWRIVRTLRQNVGDGNFHYLAALRP